MHLGRGKTEVGSPSSVRSGSSTNAQLVGDPGELETDDYRRRYEELLRERATEMREAASRVRSESTGRRHAEAEALASQERFRVLVEHSSDLMLIVDARGTIIYCSPSVEPLLGYRQDEVIGRIADELIDSGDLGHIAALRSRAAAAYPTRPAADDLAPAADDDPAVAAAADPAPADADDPVRAAASAAAAPFGTTADGGADRGTLRVRTKGGALRWFEWTASIHLEDEAIGGIVVNARGVTDRLLAERQVRVSELRYRMLTEASPDMIYVIGDDGLVQYVNGRGAEMFGVPAGRLGGVPLVEMFPGAAGEGIRQAVAHVLATGETYEAESEIAYPGGRRWVYTRLVALTNDVDDSVAVLGVSHDITDRRRAQEALSESERRYRKLFEDSPVAKWEEDHSAAKVYLEGLIASGVDDVERYLREHPSEYERCASLVRTRDVNHAAVALCGASSRQELIDGSVTLYPAGCMGAMPAFWAAALAGRYTSRFEEVEITVDGRSRYLMETWIVAPGHEDTFDRVYTADVDVTERHQTDDLLLRYRLLFAEARDIMWFLRVDDGRIVEANAAAEAAYGYSRGELLALTIADLRADGASPLLAEQIRTASEGGILFETEHRRKDGSLLSVEVSARGIGAGGGEKLLLGVVRDITARKRTESELAQATARLEGTLEGAVAALGTTSELRDPYTAGHQRRVAELACAIAAELGWDERRIATLHTAALLHDLGKIVVPAEILSKPGKLTDTEFLLIHQHSAAGAEILAGIDFGDDVAAIVRQHHERLDGSGYPDGLADADILPAARVLAVADVVEAMVSHRPYRPGLPLDVALGEIEQGSGLRYDAAACTACTRLMRELQFTFSRPD